MEQDINDYIDIYCERLEPGLWAEPLNAVTNISFIIAAFCAGLYAHRQGELDWKSGLLVFLLFCIGVGSTLFHTFATKLTMLSDVIPILLYQIAFIILYSLYVMRYSYMKVAGLFGVFVVLTVIFENVPTHILNGSLSYAPSILYIMGFGVWHYKQMQAKRPVLLIAALVFTVSLTFRSIDMAVCESIEMGTHFMWHILNGLVLYLTTCGFVAGVNASRRT
ncbi:MAG: ceramidase domain-containing protein [Alphaproteobacteria bacterium]